VFVWNRSTRKGKLYFDGVEAGEASSEYQGQDIDLNLTNHTTYELGYKKDTKELLHGFLRDLAIFLRPLTPGEVFTLYSTFFVIFNAVQKRCSAMKGQMTGYKLIRPFRIVLSLPIKARPGAHSFM